MNLRQLEIFRSLMVNGTTVAAAHHLNMSQPAVSNAIKHLESVIGFVLFERKGNQLVPTDEARTLYERAEPLFQLLGTVNQSAEDIRAGHVGRVRVVATSEVTEALMPMAMAKFLTACPEIYVTLDTKPLHNVLEAVESGIADIGFAMDPGERHSLILQPIETLRTVCVCAADNPLAALPFVTPQDLVNDRLICPLSGTRIANLLEEAFRKSSLVYSPKVEVRFLNAAAQIVQEGWGVAILDEITAASGRYADLAILPFEPSIRRSLMAILPRQKTLSRPAREFVNTFILEAGMRVAALREAGANGGGTSGPEQ